MSSASSTKPNGSIHSPNSGRILKRPPTISRTPTHIRSQRWEGWLNHCAVDRQLFGSKSIN